MDYSVTKDYYIFSNDEDELDEDLWGEDDDDDTDPEDDDDLWGEDDDDLDIPYSDDD